MRSKNGFPDDTRFWNSNDVKMNALTSRSSSFCAGASWIVNCGMVISALEMINKSTSLSAPASPRAKEPKTTAQRILG